MINQEMVHQDFRSVEGRFASPAEGGRGFSLLLGVWEARVALARTQEQAAIEVEDVLSQADEALVMG